MRNITISPVSSKPTSKGSSSLSNVRTRNSTFAPAPTAAALPAAVICRDGSGSGTRLFSERLRRSAGAAASAATPAAAPAVTSLFPPVTPILFPVTTISRVSASRVAAGASSAPTFASFSADCGTAPLGASRSKAACVCSAFAICSSSFCAVPRDSSKDDDGEDATAAGAAGLDR